VSRPLSIIADQQILLAREAFSKFGVVRLVDGRSIDQQMLKDADVLLVRSVTQVDESLLKESKISFVGSATSGIDHIDIEYLEKSSICFSHALGCNARSVAEYVLSSLLVTAKHLGFSLTEKTVGIIGCGQIGSWVRHFMDTLGVQCVLNDPPLYEQTCDRAYVELERVLEADIVTLHVPLTIDSNYPTYKLVNKKLLDRLKSNVIIINTSRGEVIDETDLLEFKESNPKSTLILDVWCNEPEINIILLQQTFIATPHIAGYSYDGKLKATEMLVDALNSAKNMNTNDDRLLNPKQVKDFIEYHDDDDVIQLAVMQSYDVRSDANALGNLKSISREKRVSYFDSLRMNYPVRHEFTNRIIQTNKITNDTKQRLQQLGFTVETG